MPGRKALGSPADDESDREAATADCSRPRLLGEHDSGAGRALLANASDRAVGAADLASSKAQT
jgi:hypothetical protein